MLSFQKADGGFKGGWGDRDRYFARDIFNPFDLGDRLI
jgi:hypothetical protein